MSVRTKTGMGGTMRRIIAVFLAVGLVASPFPSAFAEEPDAAREGTDAVLQESVAALKGEDSSPDPAAPETGDGAVLQDPAASAIGDEEIDAVLEGIPSMEEQDSSRLSFSSTLSASGDQILYLAGTTQYDTAAEEALFSFSSSSTAIVVSGEKSADALAAVPLAGALDCPILLTAKTELPQATSDALQSLGVTKIVIVGGSGIISTEVEALLAQGRTLERVFGTTQYDTQVEIFRYGKTQGLWNTTGTFFVSTGIQGNFADALSTGPAAYKLKAPIFFVDETGRFPEVTAKTLLGDSGLKEAYVAGGTSVVSEEAIGFLDFVTLSNGGVRKVSRLAGKTLYDTSVVVAQWATAAGILTWDNAAFSTGLQPYDALAGSVVQGRSGAVLLLIDPGATTVIDGARASGASISHVRFFGGPAVVSYQTRMTVCTAFGIPYFSVGSESFNISLSRLADIEVAKSVDYQNYSKDEILESLNPSNTPLGSASFFQFAVLTDGYSGITAEQLDAYIGKMVVYQESRYNVTSKLRGTGTYFVAASKAYGINEVYLLCHAALESAWGCSPLAQGTVSGYAGYLNFYGIGAADANPGEGGLNWQEIMDGTPPKKRLWVPLSGYRAIT